MIAMISSTANNAPKMAAMIIPAIAPAERPGTGGAGGRVEGWVVGVTNNDTAKASNPLCLYSSVDACCL